MWLPVQLPNLFIRSIGADSKIPSGISETMERAIVEDSTAASKADFSCFSGRTAARAVLAGSKRFERSN